MALGAAFTLKPARAFVESAVYIPHLDSVNH